MFKKERIQKILAQGGYGSRRQIESLILAGRVTLNKQIAKLGDHCSLDDSIYIDNQLCPLAKKEKTRVLLYHKPIGEVSTRHDPEGRPTVFDSLPQLKNGRWINVGRLDINTSGLLLFTNSGELAHRFMHPSFQVEREYAVRIHGSVSPAIIQKLLRGVKLEDGPARFEKIIVSDGQGKNQWFYVTVREGRNRLVRRLWESQGVSVSRLIRVRLGSIVLPRSLPAGAYIEIFI